MVSERDIVTAVLSTIRETHPIMKRRALIPVIRKREPDEEDDISKKMFAEYREENGKDLEREGGGTW